MPVNKDMEQRTWFTETEMRRDVDAHAAKNLDTAVQGIERGAQKLDNAAAKLRQEAEDVSQDAAENIRKTAAAAEANTRSVVESAEASAAATAAEARNAKDIAEATRNKRDAIVRDALVQQSRMASDQARIAADKARIAENVMHRRYETARGVERKPAPGSKAERWLHDYDQKVSLRHAAPIGVVGANDEHLSYETPDAPLRLRHATPARVLPDTPTAEASLRQALAEATMDGAEQAAISPRETLAYARDEPSGQYHTPRHERTTYASRAQVRAVPAEEREVITREPALPARELPPAEVGTPIVLDREPRYVPDDGVLRKVKLAKHGNYEHVSSDSLPKVNEAGYATAVRNAFADAADVLHAKKLRDKLRPGHEEYAWDAMNEKERRRLAAEIAAASPTMRVDEEEVLAELEG